MQPMQDIAETRYEKNQRFNGLVAWLHSVRYKNILSVVGAVADKAGQRPIRIIDIGCAHAKLFAVLNERFQIDYTGIEIDSVFAEAARARYGQFENFRVVHDSILNALPRLANADVLVAMETCEHILEHDVVRIIEAVAASRPTLFVCSVPVEIGPSVWLKNVGSLITGYMRHREYRWAETFWAGFYQLDRLPPHDTGHKGFDWRWLAQTIRHNMKIVEIRKFPFGFLPAGLAFSVFMISEPRL